MSDLDEDMESESSGEDFSASESDDWEPEKAQLARVTSDSSDEEDFESPPVAKRSTKKPSKTKPTLGVKSKKTPTSVPAQNDDDDSSSSSGDDCLVDPNKLDLESTFFQPSTSGTQSQVAERPPVFDCNAGLGQLSDSDDGEDMEDVPAESQSSHPKPADHVNLNKNELFMLNLEKAKEHLVNFKSDTFGKDDGCDVSQLLAMGEKSSSTSAALPKKRKVVESKKKTNRADSGSDWEEVADKKPKITEDVVITVRPTVKQKKDRNQLEMEAQIRRTLNRRLKELQLMMHKAHILCWIGHGNHVNAALNHPKLMQLCLAFMPSKYTYPKDRTDLTYFEQITKWYASQMKLKDDRMHPALERLPPLVVSLALQIQSKEAICRKMYVLIFVVLLRAIGVRCRVVMNLVTLPMRPAQSELCPVFGKEESGAKKSKSTTDVKKESVKTEKIASKVQSKSNGSHSAKKDVKVEDSKPNSIPKTASSKDGKGQTKSSTKVLSSKSSKSSELPTKIPLVTSPHFASTSSSSAKSPLKSTSSKSMNKSSPSDRTASGTKIKTSLKPTEKTSSTPSHVPSSSSPIAKSPRKSTSRKSVKFASPTKTKPSPKPTEKTSSSKEQSPRFHSTQSPNQHKSERSSLPSKSSKPVDKPPTTATKSTEKPPTATVQSPHFRSTQSPNQQKPKPTRHVLDKTPVFASPVSRRTRSRIDKLKKLPHLPQLDGVDDLKPSSKSRKRPNLTQLKSAKKSRASSDSEDSDYTSPSPRKRVFTSKPANKQVAKVKKSAKVDRRLLSTDTDGEDEETKPKKNTKATDVWLEVYSEAEEQWMAVDLFKQKIHSVESIRQSLTKPISYVLAWNNDNSIRDVSSRYCVNWNTVTRKQRVEQTWLDQALQPYRETPTFRSRAEDLELNKIHLKEPLPKTIGEFKDHPLYALQRHLLKFQGIYPPDAPTLGFIRGEPIYSRDCVHTLHSREIWVKSARVVKPGETAYKIVKARPKWDRHTNTCADALPLEIFGFWQTQKYDPPTAENGIVPRNAYGNVELFLPEMLPKKTRHLQLPGLNRTCKKLNIDCANAVVGFDYHSGSCHPTYDGFVVCEEFAEQAMEQYWLDQEEAQRREEEKIKQRVYGNWKKLIKGLLIRERLQRKYNFAQPSDAAVAGTSKAKAPKSRK